MKYLTEERFIVSSNTKEALRNYADNYDRIFGEPECSCPHGDAREDMHDRACPCYLPPVAPGDLVRGIAG